VARRGFRLKEKFVTAIPWPSNGHQHLFGFTTMVQEHTTGREGRNLHKFSGTVRRGMRLQGGESNERETVTVAKKEPPEEPGRVRFGETRSRSGGTRAKRMEGNMGKGSIRKKLGPIKSGPTNPDRKGLHYAHQKQYLCMSESDQKSSKRKKGGG